MGLPEPSWRERVGDALCGAERRNLAERRDTGSRRSPLEAIADMVVRFRRAVLVVAAVVAIAAAAWGADAPDRLSSGGYVALRPQTLHGDHVLRETFGVQTPNLLLVARANVPADAAAATAAGVELTARLRAVPGVAAAESYWTLGDPALRSRDGRAGVVLVRLAGDEDAAQDTAAELVPRLDDLAGILDVAATGEAAVNAELQEISDRDLARAEVLAAPVVLLLLLLVFRTPLAAALPFVIGALAVVITLAVLKVLAALTDVSVFALNLTTALGFGLAIDYSLFLLVRYREECRRAPAAAAGRTTVLTAGRTVLFSALTVAASLAALLVFPLYFLRSLAYAAIPVVLAAGLAAVLVVPAALVVLGPRTDAYDVRDLLHRVGRRPLRLRPVTETYTPRHLAAATGRWGRLAAAVMRRPLSTGLPVTLALALLATPLLHVRFGLTDDRVLPRSAEAFVAARQLERQFDTAVLDPVHVVLEGRVEAEALTAYASLVSALPTVAAVDTGTGGFANGFQQSPPAGPLETFQKDGVTRLAVVPREAPQSPASEELVRRLRDLPAPNGASVSLSGTAVASADTKDVIAERLPAAGGIITSTTLVLLFLFTGSVLLPVKALLFTLFSLTASFGAMVYVFQDGNLRWLVGDFVATGYLDVTVPVLLFCVAFGLAMDYEVFVLSRIREAFLRTGDNRESVITGMAAAGPLISAAALLIGVVLLALATSRVPVLKLLGLGLFLAVLMDSLVVRGVLVPSFMAIAPGANWWAPRSLRRLHARIGLGD